MTIKYEQIDNISSIAIVYANLTNSRPNKFKLVFIEKHSKNIIAKEWTNSSYLQIERPVLIWVSLKSGTESM